MPILHDPYADIDRIRWMVAFFALIALMMLYGYFIVRLPTTWKFRALRPGEILIVAFGFSIIFACLPLPFQTLQPFVKAPAYKWPVGCDQKIYRLFDPISRNCGDQRYAIKNYRDYGLKSHAGKTVETEYFRVGNDAI